MSDSIQKDPSQRQDATPELSEGDPPNEWSELNSVPAVGMRKNAPFTSARVWSAGDCPPLRDCFDEAWIFGIVPECGSKPWARSNRYTGRDRRNRQLSPVYSSNLADTDYCCRRIEDGFQIESVMSLPAIGAIDDQVRPSWAWDGKEPIVPATDGAAGEPVTVLRCSPVFSLVPILPVGSIWELFFCSEARREPSRNYPLEPDGNRNKQNQQGGSPHAKVAYHACTLFNVSN
jgi:hypothetical protein